jgi:biopolymer transport protein ExbD
MSVNIKKGRAFDAVNLTSVMDLVFLLLIFFMVTSQFADEERALELPLPSASEAKPLASNPTELFVNIDKDGRYFLNGRFMKIDEVEATLRQAKANNPVTQTVAIRADRLVPFQVVVSVVNLCVKIDAPHRLATADEE